MTFRQLSDEHLALLQSQAQKQDVVESATAFIKKVQSAGNVIGEPREREQLRAYLRYWASYVYDQTQTYINADLSPYTGQLFALRANRLWLAPLLLLGVLLALVILGWKWLSTVSPTPSPTPTRDVEIGPTQTPESFYPELQTAAASEVRSTAEVLQQTASALAMVQTATANIQFLTPTPPTPGSLAVIQSPANGTGVPEVVVFEGSYVNLKPGWQIVVLVQPVNGDSFYYNMGTFVVPEGTTSGRWDVKANLSSFFTGRTAQTLLVTLVIANNEAGFKMMDAARN
ncbi:MAG TPA: hypothetical protein PKG95_01025, partial [Anaerolineaceae bacterium]|nr:hypothetical protein [Anaerolineaceae bacterium]